MKTIAKTLAVIAAAVAALSAQADVISLSAASGGWMATTPPGAAPNNSYPSPSPIGSVGLAWEAANVGWNSSAGYDASAWSAYAGGWINASGITPFYARKVFNIGGTPLTGSFSLLVDDDSQVWVNGTLVPGLDDHNMGTANPYPSTADISSYLHAGSNVIAFKAHNSAGGGFSVSMGGSVSFEPRAASTDLPEPASLALAGLALTAAFAVRRKRSA